MNHKTRNKKKRKEFEWVLKMKHEQEISVLFSETTFACTLTFILQK
jgi:hypothetical protein